MQEPQQQTAAKPAADYSSAAIPEPYRILGLRLRPFSLGHYLLLRRFGCAFVQEESGFATRDDLLLGVLVCSKSYEQFLEFIEQKNFLTQVARWGSQCAGAVPEIKEKAELFKRYLSQSLDEPAHIMIQPGGGGGDWAQTLKITLVTRLRYTESEALNAPLSKCLADYYRLAEQDGVIRLLTQEDIEAADENTKILESLNAK